MFVVFSMALLMTLNVTGAVALQAPDGNVLEVTGALERIEVGQEGDVIVLNVSGKEASGPLDPDCVFLGEDGSSMRRDDFLRRYLKRYVTLELGAEDGVVRLCRVGS